MKAILYTSYGPPDVLKFQDVAVPTPKEGEVLVRVKAVSINSWDWDMIRGTPIFVRMWGLFSPRHKIPGADIAGIVECVGKGVTKFKAGDEVFGDLCESGWGGFAEYATAKENALAIKPAYLSFEDAAAIPQAGLMALQSVYDKGKIRTGQHVLFNGAAGGVGTFAIQMCKSIGAEVTAVDASAKLEFLSGLGADRVIDYINEDFTKNNRRYDYIIDVVANRPLTQYRDSLTHKGSFIMIGGTTKTILKCMLVGKRMSTNGKQIGMLAYKPNAGLDTMATLYHDGKVKPIIDKRFPLSHTRAAFEYFATGAVKGKVVVSC
jgi:NADPH:quinone reductase-like Zn-dependent oxidoreductase